MLKLLLSLLNFLCLLPASVLSVERPLCLHLPYLPPPPPASPSIPLSSPSPEPFLRNPPSASLPIHFLFLPLLRSLLLSLPSPPPPPPSPFLLLSSGRPRWKYFREGDATWFNPFHTEGVLAGFQVSCRRSDMAGGCNLHQSCGRNTSTSTSTSS